MSQGERRRFADRAAHHRDPGRRRLGVHPDQRHLHHRRPDLLRDRPLQLRRASGVNVGLSVSRVGFARQIKATKQVGSTLKLDLAQYRELAAFAQFGSDLDKVTQNQLNRGAAPHGVAQAAAVPAAAAAQQVAILFAGVRACSTMSKSRTSAPLRTATIRSSTSAHPDILDRHHHQEGARRRPAAAPDRCNQEYKQDFLAGLKDNLKSQAAGSRGGVRKVNQWQTYSIYGDASAV
jgi:hypothetical protein